MSTLQSEIKKFYATGEQTALLIDFEYPTYCKINLLPLDIDQMHYVIQLLNDVSVRYKLTVIHIDMLGDVFYRITANKVPSIAFNELCKYLNKENSEISASMPGQVN